MSRKTDEEVFAEMKKKIKEKKKNKKESRDEEEETSEDEGLDEETEETEEEEVEEVSSKGKPQQQIVERVVNLALINDKLNFIISVLQKKN